MPNPALQQLRYLRENYKLISILIPYININPLATQRPPLVRRTALERGN